MAVHDIIVAIRTVGAESFKRQADIIRTANVELRDSTSATTRDMIAQGEKLVAQRKAQSDAQIRQDVRLRASYRDLALESQRNAAAQVEAQRAIIGAAVQAGQQSIASARAQLTQETRLLTIRKEQVLAELNIQKAEASRLNNWGELNRIAAAEAKLRDIYAQQLSVLDAQNVTVARRNTASVGPAFVPTNTGQAVTVAAKEAEDAKRAAAETASANSIFSRFKHSVYDDPRDARRSAFGMFLVGGALIAGVAASVVAFSRFEQQMRNVQSIGHETGKQFEYVFNRVLDISRQLPITAKDAAAALYQIVSSGVGQTSNNKDLSPDFKDIAAQLSVLQVSSIAASAGLTNAETSARGIVAVMNAYGRSAADASEISDVLFQTVNIGVLSFEELTQQLGDFVAFGAQSGVSLEQLGVAMSAITRAGVPAAEASTSLNRVLQAFVKPSVALRGQLTQMGFAQTDVATKTKITAAQADNFNKTLAQGQQHVRLAKGDTLTLSQTMEILRIRTGGNIATLQKLFPEIRAARGAMALWANDGKNLNNVLEQFTPEKVIGATARALAEQQKGLSYQFQVLKNNITADFIDIGKSAEAPLKFIFDAVTKVADGFAALPKPILGIIGIVGALGGTALIAIAGFVALTSVIVKLGETFKIAALSAERVKTASVILLALTAAVIAVTTVYGYFKKQAEDVKALVPQVATIMSTAASSTIAHADSVKSLTKQYASLAAQNSNIRAGVDRYKLNWLDVGKALQGTNAEYKKFTDSIGNAGHKGWDLFFGAFTGDTEARFKLVRDLDKIRAAQVEAQKQLGTNLENRAIKDQAKSLGGLSVSADIAAASTVKLTADQKQLQTVFNNILDVQGAITDANELLYNGQKTPQAAFADVVKNLTDNAKKKGDEAAKEALAQRKQNIKDQTYVELTGLKERNNATVQAAQDQINDLKRVGKAGFTDSLALPGSSVSAEVKQRQEALSKLKSQNSAEEHEVSRHADIITATYKEYAGGVRVSIDDLIKGLNDQRDQQNSFYDDMSRIAKVTKDDGGKFVQSLRDLGDQAPPIVATLADSTDADIKRVENAFDGLAPSADKTLTAFRDTLLQHVIALKNEQINAQIVTGRGYSDLANLLLGQGEKGADALAAAAKSTNTALLNDLSTTVQNGLASTSDQATQDFSTSQQQILAAVSAKGGKTTLQDVFDNLHITNDQEKTGVLLEIEDIKKALLGLPGADKPLNLIAQVDVALGKTPANANAGAKALAAAQANAIAAQTAREAARGTSAAPNYGRTGAFVSPLLPLAVKYSETVRPIIEKGIKDGTVKSGTDALAIIQKAFTKNELEAMLYLTDPKTGLHLINAPGGIQGYFAKDLGLPLGKDVDLGLVGPDGQPLTQHGLDPYIKDPSPKNVPLNPTLLKGAKTVKQLLEAGGVPNVDVAVGVVQKALQNVATQISGLSLGSFADGGVREAHNAQIAPAGAMRVWAEPETGGEAYIPLGKQKRGRSVDILQTVADRFGYGLHKFAQGGLLDAGGGLSATATLRPNASQFMSAGQQIATNLLTSIVSGLSAGGGFLGFDPGKGGVGVASVGIIERIMAQSGLPDIVTSAFRAGDGRSYHATGNAVDFGWAGNDPKGLMEIAQFWSRYTPGLLELIHGSGFLGNVKNGVRVGDGLSTYGAATMAQHADHVHVAATLDSLHKLFAGGFAASGTFNGVPHGSSNVGGSAVAIGQRMAAARGWIGPEWNALFQLWNGESNWNPNIVNPDGGAYGIPQILPSAHGHPVALGDAAGQIAWGLQYIGQKYGDPLHAYALWLSRSPHWYASGAMEDHRAQMSGGNVRVWGEPETGGEAYIPLSSSKRAGSMNVLGSVASHFGYGLQRYADGGVNFNPISLGDNSGGSGQSGFFFNPQSVVSAATSGTTGKFDFTAFKKQLDFAVGVYGDWTRKLGIITRRAGASVSNMLRDMGADGRDAINALVQASDSDVKRIVANLTKLGDAAKGVGTDLASALDQAKSSLKDQQEFEKDLLNLAQRNFIDLALQLQSMGVESGLPLARQAVTTKNGLQLIGLELSVAGAQNLLGDDLQTGLKIMQLVSQGGGKTGIHAVAAAMQLSESDIVALLKKGLLSRITGLPHGAGAKIASDYTNAIHGHAYAQGGYQAGIARGLRVFGEPETGGEAYIPLAVGKRPGAMRVLRQVMQHFGVDEFANGGVRLPVGAQMNVMGGGNGSRPVVVVRVDGSSGGSVPPIGHLEVNVQQPNATANEIVQEAYWAARTVR